MDQLLSYDELGSHFFNLFVGMAQTGQNSLPIFSGDLSVALRLRHRVVKDMIEIHFKDLQQAYGRSIQVLRYKRQSGCRAMRGYLLPFRVAAQLLPFFGDAGLPLLTRPEILYACFVGVGCPTDLLN